MIFADRTLTQRVEMHEAWSATAHATRQAELYPATKATSLSVGGGYAVFAGPKAPLSGVYGLGLAGPVPADDLDQIENFYRSRGMGVTIRLCPLADPTLLDLLRVRKYSVQSFMNVYVRQMEGAFASSVPTEIDVRIATIEEARAWYASAGAGGAWAEPDGISFMLVRCVQKPGARLFIAWREGQMLGAGGFELHDGVAALMAASTLPVFRNQGVQTALLRARLAAAQAAGADLVVVHTEPGTASQRNVLRAGFELIYTIVNVVGPR